MTKRTASITAEREESNEQDRKYKKLMRGEVSEDGILPENNEAMLSKSFQPKILYEHGLRRILPYDYQFRTHAKGRWVGKTIFSVFETEFQDRPSSYYKEAIELGLIQVNNQKVFSDYILKNNDLMTHQLHRHEPCVPATRIPVLAESKDWVIINKPAGIPVHPAGRYHYNSILSLLDIEHNLKVVAINRLDRLTSGIMLLNKNRDKIDSIQLQFRSHVIQKEYLCRVKGKFPEAITCNEPILPASLKLGVHKVHPDGKPCQTDFKLLTFNGEESIVLAFPRTGRTHQIRVHLKHLGFPIMNDPIYTHSDYASTISDTDIAIMKKKEFDEKSFEKCPECKQNLMPPADPTSLVIYLHALRYSIKQDLGFGESEYIHYDTTSNTTVIQTHYPDWANLSSQ